MEPLRQSRCQLESVFGSSCNSLSANCVMPCMPLDYTGMVERGVLVAGDPVPPHIFAQISCGFYRIQPATSSPPSIFSFSPKPCGDGRVATVTGAGWHWELLVMDLHTGGPSRMVAVFLTLKQEDTSVPLGWQSSLFQGQHCSPHWGKGLENVT